MFDVFNTRIPHKMYSPGELGPMKTPNRDEIFAVLQACKDELRTKMGVQRIALFGSALYNELDHNGGIDILVDVEDPNDYTNKLDIIMYLEDHLGRTVHLAIRQNLNPELRPNIEAQAEYA